MLFLCLQGEQLGYRVWYVLKYVLWEFTAMHLSGHKLRKMFRLKPDVLIAVASIALQEKLLLTGWVEISWSTEVAVCYQWHSSRKQVCLLSRVIGQVTDSPSLMHKDRERKPETSKTISSFLFSVHFLTVSIFNFYSASFVTGYFSLLFFPLKSWADYTNPSSWSTENIVKIRSNVLVINIRVWPNNFIWVENSSDALNSDKHIISIQLYV